MTRRLSKALNQQARKFRKCFCGLQFRNKKQLEAHRQTAHGEYDNSQPKERG